MTADAGRSPFPVRFAVWVPRPPVDLEISVAADGTCDVEILTDTTLPQTAPPRLGRFRATIEAPAAAALAEIAIGATAAGRAPGGPADSGAQLVAVFGGPLVPAPDIGFDQVRVLMEAAAAALTRPIAAIEVAASQGASGIELVIRSIGTEAVPIVLFEGGNPDMWARLWRDDPSDPEGRRYVDRDILVRMVEAGRLADGTISLGPSDEVRLPLPGAGARTGGFAFWRAGAGPERRALVGSWTLSPSA